MHLRALRQGFCEHSPFIEMHIFFKDMKLVTHVYKQLLCLGLLCSFYDILVNGDKSCESRQSVYKGNDMVNCSNPNGFAFT